MLAELTEKLVETSQHAEELLGRKPKLTPLEFVSPVMFLLDAWETFMQSAENPVRAVALQDGASDVSLQAFQELDYFYDFANWAYDEAPRGRLLEEELATRGFVLVYHDKETLIEKAAHFLAFNESEKMCVISVKGTSTVHDCFTD